MNFYKLFNHYSGILKGSCFLLQIMRFGGGVWKVWSLFKN